MKRSINGEDVDKEEEEEEEVWENRESAPARRTGHSRNPIREFSPLAPEVTDVRLRISSLNEVLEGEALWEYATTLHSAGDFEKEKKQLQKAIRLLVTVMSPQDPKVFFFLICPLLRTPCLCTRTFIHFERHQHDLLRYFVCNVPLGCVL